MGDSFKKYYSDTRTLLYSFLFSVPLLVIYETVFLLQSPSNLTTIRNGVDVWMKGILSIFGANTVSITLLIALVVGLIIMYKERHRLRDLKAKYFRYMLAESFVLSILVLLLVQFVIGLVFSASSGTSMIHELSSLEKFTLSLGAGLYEELFFRVILVSALIYLFKYVFKGSQWAPVTAAVLLSALLFSAAHYIGEFGDQFTINSFTFRFLFGLLLNGIYVWRGFGIAAWTHAIYDLLVFFVF